MNFLESLSKYHKIIIVSGICLALFSLVDKTLAVGAVFVVFLASVALFFINKTEKKETIQFLSLLFLIVFLIHIAMVVFVYYTNFQPFSGGRGDFKEYDFVAKEISKRVPAGNFSLEGLPLVHYYPVIIGYLYIATTPSQFIGQLLNAWLVALVAVFVFLIVCQIGRSKKEGFFVGIIVGFYPSLAFYGSLLLKDASIVLLSMISLFLTLKIIKKFSWLYFFIFYIVLIGATHLRFYVSYALILNFIIYWFIFSDVKVKKRIIYGIIMIALFGFLPRFATLDGAVQGYLGEGSFKYYLNTQTITSYRQLAYPDNTPKSQPQAQPPPPPLAQAQPQVQPPPPAQTQPQIPKGIVFPTSNKNLGQGSSVVIETGFDNPISFLKNISLSFAESLLGPFPWQLTQKKHLFVLTEIVPWYFLLFFIVKGIVTSIKKDYKVMLPLIIFSVILFGVLSIYINNFGIVTRIRMPAFLALLCLLPFGLEKLKNREITKVIYIITSFGRRIKSKF